jgi:hypothetical protein
MPSVREKCVVSFAPKEVVELLAYDPERWHIEDASMNKTDGRIYIVLAETSYRDMPNAPRH